MRRMNIFSPSRPREADASAEPPSVEHIEAAIKGLEGRDKVGTSAAMFATVGGLAAGATVAGEIDRCVVWPGAPGRPGERLRDASRADARTTVLVR